MIPEDERIIADALARHMAEHVGGFETCKDSGCVAAQWVKKSAQCYPECKAEQ